MIENFTQYIDTIVSGIAGSIGGFIFGKANRRSIEVDTLIKTIKNHEESIEFQGGQIKKLQEDLNHCRDEMIKELEHRLKNNDKE